MNTDATLAPVGATRPAAIELANVSVRHGRRIALDGLTGQFEPGSLTAVIGPNGAGKSTLLNTLAGLSRPSAGTISNPALACCRLAYLQQQQDHLDRDYPVTVGEIVALGLWRQFGPLRPPPPTLVGQTAAAIDAVGLTGLATRRIGELSVGQMRRAFFARLLLLDAEVILLDEPFAAVDARTVEVLLALIATWHREGRTVIAVVHDFDQVRTYFPATLILARQPIAWGPTEAVLTEDNLAHTLSGA